MIEVKSKIQLSIVILITVGFGGCVAPIKEPKFISPMFNVSEIDTIYVMPVLSFFETDYVKESFWERSNLDKYARKGSEGQLEKCGYKYIWLQDRSLINGIRRDYKSRQDDLWFENSSLYKTRTAGPGWIKFSPQLAYRFISLDDISKPDHTWLSKIDLPEARWFLFFILEDFELMTNVYYAFDDFSPDYITVSLLSVHLFDKRKGKIIWSNWESLGSGINSYNWGDRFWDNNVTFRTKKNMKGLPCKN